MLASVGLLAPNAGLETNIGSTLTFYMKLTRRDRAGEVDTPQNNEDKDPRQHLSGASWGNWGTLG